MIDEERRRKEGRGGGGGTCAITMLDEMLGRLVPPLKTSGWILLVIWVVDQILLDDMCSYSIQFFVTKLGFRECSHFTLNP